MNEAEKKSSPDPSLDEADVAAYLQAHPKFLQRYPAVLTALDMRHDAGSAVSLIERQVNVLRDANRELQSRLNELMEMARGNEQRVTQLNSLAKVLVSADRPAELVADLSTCLQREMDVDAVFVGVRSAHDLADGAIRGLAEGDPRTGALTHVFRRGKPICGALSTAQSEALFGGEPPPLTSAAMIPLGVHGVHGAMVLASCDAERFVPEMGTLFLELMGELVTTALRRHLGAEMLP